MPAEAPAAPAVDPALTTTASPTPDRGTAPSLDDFDKHFNDLEGSAPEAPNAEPPETTPEPSKTAPPKDPVTGKFTKPEPKPVAKPEPKPEADPKPKVEPKPEDEYTPPQVATGSALRKFATQAGEKARRAASELNQVRAELAKLKTQPNQESAQIVAELADAKKKIAEYEREAQLTRYERSAEYKDKYEKPYQSAVQQAYSDVKELLVSEPAPTEEDPNATKDRQATAADFDEIYNLPLGPATRLAKQKFGDSAFIVLQHRTAIKNSAKAALEAIEQHKAKAGEYEQQQTAQQKLQEEGRSQMFNTAIEDIRSKHAEVFGEREGDTDWNEGLAKGKSMADMAFGDRQGLTPQQSVILDAHVYNRLMLSPALLKDNAKLRSEVKKLTDELTQIRSSAPGKPSPAGKPVQGQAKSWDARFDEMVPE